MTWGGQTITWEEGHTITGKGCQTLAGDEEVNQRNRLGGQIRAGICGQTRGVRGGGGQVI